MLNIVVALHCEAKPIIKHFRLKKITHIQMPFPVFVNRETGVQLIVSGVGKVRMAAATSFLFCWSGQKSSDCFLNVGIAGSAVLKIGEFVLANKIMDHQRSWFPFVIPFKHKKQTALTTVDCVTHRYPIEGMQDMEAAAFFQTASLYVSQEQIQVAKVISDSDRATLEKIDEKSVAQWMHNALPELTEIVDYLVRLSAQEEKIIYDEGDVATFLEKWHFTQTQTFQLKEYLRKWHIHLSQEDLWRFCHHATNAKQVLSFISQKLDHYANCLS